MRSGERGSGVIAAVIAAFLIVLLTIPFLNWGERRNKEVTQQSSISQAQWYADSGIELAQKLLKAPDLDLTPGEPQQLPVMAMRQGSCEVTLKRSTLDTSLVEMDATGYFHLPGSPYRDSAGKSAMRSRVRVVSRVLNVADFLVAKPKKLTIEYGTDVSNGKVYGDDLEFLGRGSNLGPATQVGEALYFENLTGVPSADVVTSIPPRKLPRPLDLGIADVAMRNLYLQRTQGAGSVSEQTLDVTQPFSGVRAPPPGGAPNIYFAAGDLHVGTPTEPLHASGVYTIYVTGSVFIHNSILLQDNASWIAIVTEKDFVILDDGAPDFAPANLELNGNYYANGGWLVNGARPANSTLQFRGGFVVHGRIEFALAWASANNCTRTYTFARSPSPQLLLPNLTTQLDYRVLAAR